MKNSQYNLQNSYLQENELYESTQHVWHRNQRILDYKIIIVQQSFWTQTHENEILESDQTDHDTF